MLIRIGVGKFGKEILKAIEAGCNDYISKPINIDELLSLIQKYGN
jgi:CheY-like chemotaxis protein